MKNRLKRILSACLALAAVLALFAGCQKTKAETDPGTSGGSGDVYVANYITLPDEVPDMYNSVYAGDKIYFMSQVPVRPDGSVIPQDELQDYYDRLDAFYEEHGYDEAEGAPAMEYTYQYRLYSIGADGSGLKHLESYVSPESPKDNSGSTDIRRLVADAQGNIWALECATEYKFDLPEGFDPETGNQWEYYSGESNTYSALKLDGDGKEISRICLNDFVDSAAVSEYFYLHEFAVDASGNLYFDDGNGTSYVIGADGSLAGKTNYEGWINGYINLSDGSVIAGMNGEGGTKYCVIDPLTGSFSKTYDSKAYSYNYINGNEEFDFCYNNGSSLIGYDLETDTETRLVNWINSDIDSDSLQQCALKENGDIFVITYNHSSSSASTRYEVANLVKTPASQVERKESISLATFGLDQSLRGAIINFNKTNPKYRIEVRDYTEYNTSDDYTAGLTKLNTEIISGNIPDIIAVNQLPDKQYAAKGLLEDLYPYIEKDSAISMDDLQENVFAAMADEGKLYSIASSFSVVTVVGKPSVLGTDAGWTMTQFKELVDSYPEADYPLGMYVGREDIFSTICTLNMGSYVNWLTGECSFDSQGFKSLLEFAKGFPGREEFSYDEGSTISEAELISQNRMIASFFALSDFRNYQYYKAMYGGDIVFKGLPGEDGGGNVAMVDGGLALTISCKNKDAAWEFMRTILMEDFQKENVWNFPTNKNVFNEKLDEAMKQEYDAEGKPISSGGMSDGVTEVSFYAMTQEEADQILGLIGSISYASSFDTSITDIVSEEAAAYFNGEKTVDEVAALIQSRVNIYINEQR